MPKSCMRVIILISIASRDPISNLPHYVMRCHSKKEDEQPFGVLVAHELGGVRVAKVEERHLEERGPVQVLRHLKDTRNLMTLYREH